MTVQYTWVCLQIKKSQALTTNKVDTGSAQVEKTFMPNSQNSIRHKYYSLNMKSKI